MAGPLDNGGRKRSYSTGTPSAPSVSPRPPKNALPKDLDNGGRRSSASNGTKVVAGANSRNASAPKTGGVPRGYVHNQSNFTPATRKTGSRVKKGVS